MLLNKMHFFSFPLYHCVFFGAQLEVLVGEKGYVSKEGNQRGMGGERMFDMGETRRFLNR